MSRAFVFPGQGSEAPRMGLELAARSGPAKALLERAGDATGVDLFRLLERGGRALDRTEVTQPAIVAASLGVLLEFRALGVEAEVVAGHSLGELTAWCGAGHIDAETAVDLAVTRARLMAEAARAHPGGMLALIDVAEVDVAAALELGRARGVVELAGHNGPRDWALSGDLEALAAVAKVYRSTPIRVAGPWHSSRMVEAAAGFAAVLARVAWTPGRAALVSCVTGRVARAEEIPALEAEVLTRPLRWAEVMSTLAGVGVTEVLVVGPGKPLATMARVGLPAHVTVRAVERPEDLAALGRTAP